MRTLLDSSGETQFHSGDGAATGRNLAARRALSQSNHKELRMATTAAGKTASQGTEGDISNLEADIRQLKADIEKLTRHMAATGQHGYGTAKRAAAEGVEQLRAQGEAAFDSLRSNARDLEDQLVANVREKPVTSLAIAAGVGFLFALLSRR